MSGTGTNLLLQAMSPEDAGLLSDRLEPVEMERRQVLERPRVPITHIYFIDSGVSSVVAMTTQGRQIEAGLFGREGMSGLAVVLGVDRTANTTFIQIPGQARRLPAEDLREAMGRSATLRPLLLRFVQVQMLQTAHTALANGQAKIEERLARWLLMCHDRLDGDDLPLTHEFLSLMLGVRRAGVTVALSALEKHGLIGVRRGGCVVLDREGLEALADGIYGIPEGEYRRLFCNGSAAATPARTAEPSR